NSEPSRRSFAMKRANPLHLRPSLGAVYLAIFLSALPARAVPQPVLAPSQSLGVMAASRGKTRHLASPDEIPQGLIASDWSSIQLQYEQHRHAAFPSGGGHQARNPAQQWLARFDGRGLTT